MSPLAGTVALVRLVTRRDRVRIVVWVLAIVAVVTLLARSIKALYPTSAELAGAAAALRGSATQIALNGPFQGLDTIGGRVAFEVGNFGLLTVALMSIFMVGRHTRGEEERGRAELVRSTAVGRPAPLAAALVVVFAMDLAVGIGVTAGLIGQGLDPVGAVALGTSFTAVGLVFAALTAVAAQVVENTRAVYAAACTALAVSFGLRAVGDVGDGTLSWFSPLGWAQGTRPFAGERWWVLLLPAAVVVVSVAAAFGLAGRRDFGAGLFRGRPGPAAASRALSGPFGLAVRLQRISVVGWSVGLFLGGLAMGTVGRDADQFVGANDNFRDVIVTTPGTSLADSFLATFLALLALVVAGFAVQSAQRASAEEAAGHTEMLLTAAVGRARWAGTQFALAAAASAGVLAVAGLGLGTGYGLATGERERVLGTTWAALSYAPALWVLVGVSALVFGALPRSGPLVWATLAGCVAIAVLGQILDLPSVVTQLSPFQHTSRVPAADPQVVPLVALTVVAAALMAGGVAAFRQRDLR